MFLVMNSLLPLLPPQRQGLIAAGNISGAEAYRILRKLSGNCDKAWVVVEINATLETMRLTTQVTLDTINFC
ncbi:hypothetical protein BDGGKGIB_02200 [Nodularia sphaerocarpa UHCC 0038]|nr:hypothetical protein BDGGKGIB_02200 [Nodularia sphaerocarpa UHCC 0038]